MNFVKADLTVLNSDGKNAFEEYGIEPTRILLDGSGIAHFELLNGIWAFTKDDPRFTFWNDEALIEYISFVLGE